MLTIPEFKETSRSKWWKYVDKVELDTFMSNIIYDTSNISGKTLLILAKNSISQSKLRDNNFNICRKAKTADIAVINSDNYNEQYKNLTNPKNGLYHYQNDPLEVYFNDIAETLNENPNIKFVEIKDLYKYLYKYEGNLEFYNTLDELLKSNSTSNTTLAMEMMTNANWDDNQLYLVELFNKYWYNNMRNNQYKTSVSFKGLLNTLEFNKEQRLNYSNEYADYCFKDEHHEFVSNKFKQEFEDKLNDLISMYKYKLNSIDYEILK